MKILNKGLLPAAIAAAFTTSIYTQASLANPELVSDFTAGEGSSRFSDYQVLDSKLTFTVKAENNLTTFDTYTIDRQGDVVNSSPAGCNFSDDSIHFNGFDVVASSGSIWISGSDCELTHLYQFEDDSYFYSESSLYEFFIDSGVLYGLVRNLEFGQAWHNVYYSLLEIDPGNNEVVPLGYTHLPFGEPSADRPDLVDDYWPNQSFYVGRAASTGEELWSIQGEGLNRGLTLLADIKPGPKGSYPSGFTTLNGSRYFSANGDTGRELYKLDSDLNVQKVVEINPKGAAFTYNQDYGRVFYKYDGALYFLATDGVHGNELWKTDGTAQGTSMVSDSNPGAGGISQDSYFNVEFETDHGVYFKTQPDGSSQDSIWFFDNTGSDSYQVVDGPTHYHDHFPHLVMQEGTLIVSKYATYGKDYSLWFHDKKGKTSRQLVDNGGIVKLLGAVSDKVAVFMALDDQGDYVLWKTDGTQAGTQAIKHLGAQDLLNSVKPLGRIDNKFIFGVNGANYYGGIAGAIWVTDGTEGGTTLLTDSASAQDPFKVRFLYSYEKESSYVFNGKILFWGDDGVSGEELWVTDGTAAGTKLLKDIRPGVGSYNNGVASIQAVRIEDRMYFTANSGRDGVELWVTDGTEEGTKVVGPIHPQKWDDYNEQLQYPTPLNVNDIVSFNGSVYFEQYSEDYGTELWKYTPESTTPPPVTGTGSLGDFVWQDTNANGIQDAGELGLEGVTVELQSCSGDFVASTTTDSMGAYRFENVAEDHFQLQFMLPSGYEFSPEKATPEFKLDSNANETTGVSPCYDMTQGYQRLAVDAGMVPTTAPSGDGLLGDFVWQDTNGDGIQDSNEPGLAGVTVNLESCSGSIIDSMVTDSNGGFVFENIGAGDYRLEFELLDGFSFSPEKSTDLFKQDSNANETTGLTACYNMDAGWKRRAIDAGMVPDDIASADTLTIVKAIYFSAENKLWVRASSDAEPQGSAYLSASVEANGVTTDLGQVDWKADKGFYQTNFKDLAQTPSSITIISDLGGKATLEIEEQ